MSLHKSNSDCYFITATNTDSGKTYSAEIILYILQKHGVKCAVSKPVAAGAEQQVAADGTEMLINDDAQRLRRAVADPWPYQQVNPICFAAPIAPHIAAESMQQQLSSQQLQGILRRQYQTAQAEGRTLLIEGAGGWLLPLNQTETMADVVTALNIPIIMVVGLELGCLNHALLTLTDIQQRGLTVAGWIACQAKPEVMSHQAENIAFLREQFNQQAQAPLLLELAHGCSAEQALQQSGYKSLLSSVPAAKG